VMSGNVGIGTWVPSTLLSITTPGKTPSSPVGAGDVYISNNMEVDGTAYFNGVLMASALDLSGQSTFSKLEVTGQTLLNTISGNVGIGTTMTGASGSTKLAVLGGNVGIGNVTPGETLDVTGTVRATAFIGNGALLTGVPSSTVWTTTNTNDVYLPNSGNIGLGTTTTNAAALTIINGNVGIGTWAPSTLLSVTTAGEAPSSPVGAGDVFIGNNMEVDGVAYFNGTLMANALDLSGQSTFDSLEVSGQTILNSISGNVGIGTTMTGASAGTKLAILGGNVGIGNVTPSQRLDVTGTVRATAFIGNGAGLTGLMGTTQWTTTNTNDIYLPNSGNIGLGTTITNGAAISVMNGNVGIGTWVPSRALEVDASSTGTLLSTASVAAIGIHNLNTTGGNFADLAFSTLDSVGASKLGAKISGVFLSHTQNQVTGDMAFTTMNLGSASEKMRLTAAGNVGIGSSLPGMALDVNGTVRMSGNVGIGSSLTDSSGSPRLTITSSTVEINLQ